MPTLNNIDRGFLVFHKSILACEVSPRQNGNLCYCACRCKGTRHGWGRFTTFEDVPRIPESDPHYFNYYSHTKALKMLTHAKAYLRREGWTGWQEWDHHRHDAAITLEGISRGMGDANAAH